MKFIPLPIKRLDRLTQDAVRITLDTSSQPDEFNFIAGQYITFRFHLNNEELHRAYSICSSPNQHELQVAVKEVKEGRASTHINRNLKVGDSMDVLRPQGNYKFVPDPNQARHIVLFASGSGITPILSIAKTALEEEPNSRITLFYGNSNKQSIMFYTELDELAKDDRFDVFHILTDGSMDQALFNGRITFGKTLELLQHCTHNELPKVFYICGPAGMMSSVNNALTDNGFEKQQIHIEFFENPGQAFSTPKPIVEEAPLEEPFEGTAHIEVTLDDEVNNFELKGDSLNILEAAIQAGIDPPFSCRGGVCTTCRAKLTEGKVRMDSNFALTDDELEEGYILTCQAHPMTKTLKVNYDD